VRTTLTVAALVVLVTTPLYGQGTLPEAHDVRAIWRDRDTAWHTTWSPDGRLVAFVRHPWVNQPPYVDIWVVAPDGSGLKRLTGQVSGEGNWRPAWSPDSRRMAYYRVVRGRGRIWVMSADGGDPRALPEVGEDARDPAWSPDGRRIAFAASQDRNWDIYIMNSDGSGITRLTDSPDPERWPVFLRDGTKIIYERRGQLRLLDLDTRETRVTTIGPNDHHHTVSPDGAYIAYRSTKMGTFAHLWMMAAADVLEGMVPDAKARRLTAGTDIYDSAPTFAPDGTRLAFIRQTRTAGNWGPGEIWVATLR
jgi:TolB protein